MGLYSIIVRPFIRKMDLEKASRIGLGYFIGKRLKMPRKLSHLVASGTAICGGSAIAAVAPAVKADSRTNSPHNIVRFISIFGLKIKG